MNTFLDFSEKLKSLIDSIFSKMAAIILISTLLFALTEIIRRYIFSVVFQWGQDAVIFAMVSSIALYIGVTQIKRGHLVMSAALEVLNAYKYYRTIGILKIFVSISTFLFSGSLAVTGWPTVLKSLLRETKTESLTFDLWMFQFILMLGLGIMATVAFLQTIEDMIHYIQGKHLDGKLELVSDV
ncbi:MAG: TRAP transporter small permease subunit [Proteobacteria bacterium]|nr:TRAP transporter small permease subunit [Pseudomonadota bacterium]